MLLVISIEETEKWNSIVKSFKNYDVYYLSGYSKAFKIHGDGEPTLFYFEDRDIRAINVVMKRDIGRESNFLGKLTEGSYFDMTTPYGYGGFLIEGNLSEDSLKHLNNEYSSFCKGKGIISEFVRFHPIIKNSVALNKVYDEASLGETISINLNNREEIWNNLTSKNRNMVRKAQKSGIEIFWGRNPQLYEEFIHLYNDTMTKDKARDYYYFGSDFYNSILNDFKYNALIFYAIYQGKPIAMSIILIANGQMHYHLSASDIEYKKLAPTNLLLYEASCWGCENGYKSFHLGGGLGSSKDNLYKFKSGFNRKSNNNFVIGKKVFDEEKYKELVLLWEKEEKNHNDTSYFPKYRG